MESVNIKSINQVQQIKIKMIKNEALEFFGKVTSFLMEIPQIILPINI